MGLDEGSGAALVEMELRAGGANHAGIAAFESAAIAVRAERRGIVDDPATGASRAAQ